MLFCIVWFVLFVFGLLVCSVFVLHRVCIMLCVYCVCLCCVLFCIVMCVLCGVYCGVFVVLRVL